MVSLNFGFLREGVVRFVFCEKASSSEGLRLGGLKVEGLGFVMLY